MDSWLLDWLLGLFVSRIFGWLVGWFVGWLFGRLVVVMENWCGGWGWVNTYVLAGVSPAQGLPSSPCTLSPSQS